MTPGKIPKLITQLFTSRGIKAWLEEGCTWHVVFVSRIDFMLCKQACEQASNTLNQTERNFAFHGKICHD